MTLSLKLGKISTKYKVSITTIKYINDYANIYIINIKCILVVLFWFCYDFPLCVWVYGEYAVLDVYRSVYCTSATFVNNNTVISNTK